MKLLTIRNQRLKLWCLIGLILIGLSFFTRAILLVASIHEFDATFYNFVAIFLIGLLFDLANAIYFTAPFVLYLWLIPRSIFQRKGHRFVIYCLFFVMTFVLTFNAAAEVLFWDEFSARFNFIAVDYLVYTTEVAGNVAQSYPTVWIVVGIVLVSFGVVISIRKHLAPATPDLPFKQRAKAALLYCVLFGICYLAIKTDYRKFSQNAYANELAGNGMYELFSAYLHNELDYGQFYKNIGDKRSAHTCTPYAGYPRIGLDGRGPDKTRKADHASGHRKKI